MDRPRDDSELGSFFDDIYVGAGGDDTAVPWQHAASRSVVERWLADLDSAAHRRALVVAAGLGDHAAAVARLGLDVVAFDQSPAAVEWAAQRHPEVDVTWVVADLFEPPLAWIGGFDLVLEVFTIQSIPPPAQPRAARAIRDFVAPGGVLVAVALVGAPGETPTGPPWPLDPRTLTQLEVDDDERTVMVPVGGEETAAGPSTRLVRRELLRPAPA